MHDKHASSSLVRAGPDLPLVQERLSKRRNWSRTQLYRERYAASLTDAVTNHKLPSRYALAKLSLRILFSDHQVEEVRGRGTDHRVAIVL